MTKAISSIEIIINEARQGRLFILVDDETRENEGDLIIPASAVTPQVINFMAINGRGLICLAMEGAEIDRLELPMMVAQNSSYLETAFTVSIDAKNDISTGISAFDRAHTILTAINPKNTKNDLVMPGHIFPLRAHREGTLARAGHTEASVDIVKLAGFQGAAVICEILKDNGEMARLPDLILFAQKHDLKIGTIESLIRYLQPQRQRA